MSGVTQSSAGSDSYSGVVGDKASLVVDESTGEVEDGSGVVTALPPILVGGALVDLVEPFDGEAASAHVSSRSSRLLTRIKGHPVHGKCVGHRR